MRHELETATAGFRAGGELTIEWPTSDDGFLRGLVLLSNVLTRDIAQPRELNIALAS